MQVEKTERNEYEGTQQNPEMRIKIHIGGGVYHEMVITKNCNPMATAMNFCVEYNLSAQLIEPLSQKI